MTSPNTTPIDMSENSSSSSDFDCFSSKTGILIQFCFTVIKSFLILPLSILILYLGYQRWRRQRSFVTTSHSDIFTYHVTVMELTFVLGTTIMFSGIYTNCSVMILVGAYASCFVYPGEMFLNVVTCVERYLAVVHPITYLGFRHTGGVKIRNACVGCIWLLCFGWIGVFALYYPGVPYIAFLCIMVFALLIVSFCSLAVLCVLIRPGPGKSGGDRERVDQSKQKAFYTITAIMIVLLISFLGIIVVLTVEYSNLPIKIDKCVILVSANWFTLPTSLILPILFLHRAGKVPPCRNK